MSILSILLIVILVGLVAVFPAWPHSRRWGYAPAAVLGLVLVAVLVTVLARGGLGA